jgi:hypothetical protein
VVRAITMLIAIGLADAAHADSMRCGNKIVDESASIAELLELCGEPADKRVVEEDVRRPLRTGGTEKVGTTVTEYWTYDRGPRGLDMLVTIVDGKIRSIARAE